MSNESKTKLRTPQEFMRFRDAVHAAIESLKMDVCKAKLEANLLPPPANLRPAEPKDVVVGNVFWYRERCEPEDWLSPHGWYWKEVETVQWPDDGFKAYVAEDGCRYGLERAWVEAV